MLELVLLKVVVGAAKTAAVRASRMSEEPEGVTPVKPAEGSFLVTPWKVREGPNRAALLGRALFDPVPRRKKSAPVI